MIPATGGLKGKIRKMKKQILIDELHNETEPNVRMWIDKTSIFWISENQGAIWMAEHSGMMIFVDENHRVEERRMGEGVGNNGVEWFNGDFENPFHISDFKGRIETINQFHF